MGSLIRKGLRGAAAVATLGASEVVGVGDKITGDKKKLTTDGSTALLAEKEAIEKKKAQLLTSGGTSGEEYTSNTGTNTTYGN